MQDIFLPPNTPNSKVVGRFVEWTKTWTDQEGTKRERQVISLQTMVPGIAEATSKIVPPGPVGEKDKREWSAAWALFEKERNRSEPAVPVAVEHGIAGTPIETTNFLGKDAEAKLKLMGFVTVEQLADMSDTQCNRIGSGAVNWRKKAIEMLADARNAAVSRVASAPVGGPSVADLMAQLAEANAKIAALAEMMAKPAVEEAPKPRRGRPPKAAEPQPEA